MTKQVGLLTIRANDDHSRILFAAVDDGGKTAQELNEAIEQYGIDVVRRKVDIQIAFVEVVDAWLQLLDDMADGVRQGGI